MARIVVEIPGERIYDVVVSAGQIDRLGAEMRAFDSNQKALIITDTEVATRYLDLAKASLKQVGYQVSVITVPAGESAKSVECAFGDLACHGRMRLEPRFRGGCIWAAVLWAIWAALPVLRSCAAFALFRFPPPCFPWLILRWAGKRLSTLSRGKTW